MLTLWLTYVSIFLCKLPSNSLWLRYDDRFLCKLHKCSETKNLCAYLDFLK